ASRLCHQTNLTQGSQSLALGLTLTAAPQLVEGSRLISSCLPAELYDGTRSPCRYGHHLSTNLSCQGQSKAPSPSRKIETLPAHSKWSRSKSLTILNRSNEGLNHLGVD